VSFFRRLALFIVILTAMILFIGLFPVIAQSGSVDGQDSGTAGSKLLQSQKPVYNPVFEAPLP
jgi:hypothetical protein